MATVTSVGFRYVNEALILALILKNFSSHVQTSVTNQEQWEEMLATKGLTGTSEVILQSLLDDYVNYHTKHLLNSNLPAVEGF